MKIEVKKNKNVMILEMPKYFFIGNIIEVEEAWNSVISENPASIGFDCEKVEFIDSSAIGTLVKFYNVSVQKEIDMHVYALNNDIKKIFETTKIDRVMSILTKSEFEKTCLQ